MCVSLTYSAYVFFRLSKKFSGSLPYGENSPELEERDFMHGCVAHLPKSGYIYQILATRNPENHSQNCEIGCL